MVPSRSVGLVVPCTFRTAHVGVRFIVLDCRTQLRTVPIILSRNLQTIITDSSDDRRHYLVEFSTSGAVDDADKCVVEEQQVDARAAGAVTRTQVQRRQTAAVVVVHPRAEVEQCLATIRHNQALMSGRMKHIRVLMNSGTMMEISSQSSVTHCHK